MPVFEIQGPDGATYEIDAPDEQAAFTAFQSFTAPKADPQNPDGTFGQPPEGMVFDEATGQMVDTKAIADQKFGSGLGKASVAGARFASGYPVLGAMLENYGGMGDPVRQGVLEQAFKQYDDENPKSSLALRVGGAVTGIAPMLASAPTMMGANASKSLLANTGAAAGSGAAIGGIDAGIRNDMSLSSAGVGALAGGLLGGIGPSLGALIGAGGNAVRGLFGGPNKPKVTKMLADALKNAGKSADDISADLAQAASDNQGGYMVADALGNPGRRLLSTIARTPNDARTKVVDNLINRQSGQADRITNFMTDAFDASDTAAAKTAALTAERRAAASANYPASSANAQPVNLNGAISEIDAILKRNPIIGESGLSKSEIGKRLSGIRARMANDANQLVDYDAVLNLKSDLHNIRTKDPQFAAVTSKLYSALDDALEKSSEGYRLANDTYRLQSRVIDAVDAGKKASSGRMRADDTIPSFEAMTDAEKAAFRAGYADPLIGRVQAQSSAPTTNKVRSLLTEKTSKEFPVFASPGKGDRLARQLGREQSMFNTAQEAISGSKTADNLADEALLGAASSGVIQDVVSGHPLRALAKALGNFSDVASGNNGATKAALAEQLMQTNPDLAKAAFNGAITNAQRDELIRQAVARALTQAPGNTAIQSLR